MLSLTRTAPNEKSPITLDRPVFLFPCFRRGLQQNAAESFSAADPGFRADQQIFCCPSAKVHDRREALNPPGSHS